MDNLQLFNFEGNKLRSLLIEEIGKRYIEKHKLEIENE